MRVYIVVGDSPDAAFTRREAADLHCAKRRKEAPSPSVEWDWRVVELELSDPLPPPPRRGR